MMDPPILIAIADNAQCIRILTELGMVDKLQPEPPYTRAHAYFDYNGHHCVATYDKGHADEKDNGFCIIMLPEAMGRGPAYKLLEEVMNGTLAQPGGTCRYVDLGKDRQ